MKDLEDKEVRILNCILECSGSMSTSLAGAENTETEENGREKKKKKKENGRESMFTAVPQFQSMVHMPSTPLPIWT